MGLPKREELTEQGKALYDGNHDEMVFVVRRRFVETGMTFSSEAFERFLQSTNEFIIARMMKFWNVTDNPPTTMQVAIAVAIDSQSAPKTGAQTLFDKSLILCETALDTLEDVLVTVSENVEGGQAISEKTTSLLKQYRDALKDLRNEPEEA